MSIYVYSIKEEILSHSKSSPKVKSVQLSTNTGCFTPGPEEPKHLKRLNVFSCGQCPQVEKDRSLGSYGKQIYSSTAQSTGKSTDTAKCNK